MDRLQPRLREEYLRWKTLIGDALPPTPEELCSVDDFLRAHYLICDYFLNEGEPVALAGPRNADLVVSTVARQTTSFGGKVKWQTPFERLGSLCYGAVKNHPFHDGNKRTALLIALYGITRMHRTPSVPQRDFEVLALRTAADDLGKYRVFAHLRRRFNEHDARVLTLGRLLKLFSRESDSRMYRVTFNDLANVLPRFGYRLSHPAKNFIDVVRVETTVGGHPWRKRPRVVEKHILQIGFPGWTKEVGVKAIASIRRATHLTAEYGVDSQVFFHGVDAMPALIAQYHGPLSRLRDR
jgi:prophage maintenance system killer protein